LNSIATPDLTKARRLGHDAFVFGFPLLLMAGAMRGVNGSISHKGAAPPNRFAHAPRFPGPGFRAIVGAHPETLYSVAWLDLSSGPVSLKMPDVESRCYLLSLLDAWSNLFASLGPRTGAPRDGYVITGPDWSGELPEDLPHLRAPTRHAWAICHLHADEDDDLESARAIQHVLELVPLTAPDEPSDAEVEPIELGNVGRSPHRRLMEISAEQFLGELAVEMAINPPHDGDEGILADLSKIGLRPGRSFGWPALPREVREAVEVGVESGKRAIEDPPPSREENGWQHFQHDRDEVEVDYLRRAQIANFALGLANPEDAIFPLTAVDEEGNRLNGAHRYVLRFESGALPTVGALWSLALYDMDQLFVENPLDRYALGSRDDLRLGPDGSLEIVLQHQRPDNVANWLPAPEGDFNLMLHMYWPSQRVLDGSWTIPPVRRVDRLGAKSTEATGWLICPVASILPIHLWEGDG
jgi:hypothetical protein